MKWIGQLIYDQISRFRDDVYLEDISTGTIVSGGRLGLDSNNKIVKATEVGSDVDLTSEVSGALPVANGGTGATSLTDGGILLGSGTSAVTASAVLGDGEILIGDGTTDPVALDVGSSTAITTLGTIATGVWNGTAIASAYLDADTAHLSTQKHLTHHSFTADIDTTKHYVGLVDADSESTGTTAIDMPLVFPVAAKLLQVTLRSNKNLSGLTYTWRLETQATGVGFATGPTIVGTQSGAGPEQVAHTIYDFTSSLDSGDNIIDAFDAVYLSLQSGGATSNTKYYITCVWELNVSSY